MYAVLANKTICYLGSDKIYATEILESKNGASLVSVTTLTELASFYSTHFDSNMPDTNVFSQAVERVLEALDEAGVDENSVEDVVEVLKQKGQTAVTEVHHLGIKGMKTVGEGFVALGDLLKKASEDPPVDPAE